MAQMKYIRFKDEGFVIFEEWIQHSDMLERLGKNKSDVFSAGFVSGYFEEGFEPKCSGDSVSIGVRSNLNDSRSLNEKMNGYV